MAKRDYKSYNILNEELAQDEVYTKPVEVAKKSGENLKVEVIKENPPIEVSTSKQDEVKEIVSQQIVPNENKKSIKLEKMQEHMSIPLIPEVIESQSVKQEEVVKEEMPKPKEEVSRKSLFKNNKKTKQVKVDIEKSAKEEKEEDMSFAAYKTYYQSKERSGFVKWSTRLMKLILLMMLFPLLAILGTGVISVIGMGILAIGVVMVTGFVILAAVGFMSTQISSSIIALGISAAITAFALGGILLILFIMLMRGLMSLINKYKKPKKQKVRKESV